MSEIPAGAIQAAAELLYRDYDSEYGADQLSWRDFAEQARKLLEAAAPILAEQERADERRKYEDLLGSIWLYVGWRYVTKQLTTEQKNLFADAVAADLARGDGFAPGEVEAAVDRWWIDTDRPGDARDPR